MGVEDLLNRMNLPRNHWDARLSEIPDKASHKEQIVDYVENITYNVSNGRGLYLSFKQSTGKSAIAAICLKAALSKGHSGLWLACDQVPKYIIEDYEFDDDMTVVQRAETVPLLVLDEFVLSVKSEKGRKVARVGERERMIEMMVRRRIDAKKATIITSNIGPKTFEEVYPSFFRVLTESVDFVTTDSSHLFRPHK